MTTTLSGRTAVVTGGASGIGRACAVWLAQAGASVVVLDRDEAAAKEVAGQFDGRAVAVDLTDLAAVDRLGLDADILVNNAGIQLRKPLVELSVAEWQRVIDTNLTSAFVVGREAARRMIKRGKGGKVINIGSLTSEVARATVAPYTAAKGGIKLLTRSMAAEWAEHDIQANAIGPGYMLTEMNKALIENPAFDAWVKGRTPARRWGKPEELVGAAVFLASAASGYVNGQIIYVDGGMLAVL